jgi:hypothetical protein
MYADIFDFEENLAIAFQARADQVLDDFVLAIHRNGAAGEIFEVNAVASASEADLDAVVDQAFALHALADPHLVQQFHGAPFEDAGSNSLFAMLAAAVFEYN